jgi:hypothetical protein
MSGWFDYRGYDQANWGGYGEDPIPSETVALAEKLFHLLNSDRPDDAPGGDGSICFEWRYGKDDILCLDVEGDGFRVYGRIGGKHYRCVVKPDPDAAFEKVTSATTSDQ